MQTRRVFGRSCRLSKWSCLSGHQSDFAADITVISPYYFGLDFAFSTGCSNRVWPPRIVAVTTWVYSTKMLHRLQNPHACWGRQYSDKKVHVYSHHDPRIVRSLIFLTCFCGHYFFFARCHVFAVALWLVRRLRDPPLTEYIELCSWARHFTLSASLAPGI